MIYAICILLILSNVLTIEWTFRKEKDLLNRIMAKDYTELKVFEHKPKPNKEEEKPKEPDFL